MSAATAKVIINSNSVNPLVLSLVITPISSSRSFSAINIVICYGCDNGPGVRSIADCRVNTVFSVGRHDSPDKRSAEGVCIGLWKVAAAVGGGLLDIFSPNRDSPRIRTNRDIHNLRRGRIGTSTIYGTPADESGHPQFTAGRGRIGTSTIHGARIGTSTIHPQFTAGGESGHPQFTEHKLNSGRARRMRFNLAWWDETDAESSA